MKNEHFFVHCQAIWAQITNSIVFQRLIPISYCIPTSYILILIYLGFQSEAWWSAIELFQHVVAHCNTNNDDFLRKRNMSPNYKQHCLPNVDADLPLHSNLLYSYSNLIETPSRDPEISHWAVPTYVAYCYANTDLQFFSVKALSAQIPDSIVFQRLIPISYCIPTSYILIL